jgi:hypothetical protein
VHSLVTKTLIQKYSILQDTKCSFISNPLHSDTKCTRKERNNVIVNTKNDSCFAVIEGLLIGVNLYWREQLAQNTGV